MLERSMSRGLSLLVGSSSTPYDVPVLELLCAVSKIVALISHDLRQPLTSILANAEFLTQSEMSGIQRNDCYQELRWSVDRMNELIAALLECSRGQDALRLAERNIVDTVGRAIRMTAVKREFRHISIKHHHHGLAVGWFDCSRIERVVANLLLNACEAVSPELGQIVITTVGSRAGLKMSVWDNGVGISPAIREAVFQPFVSYGKAEGSGLGLAVAKKIVEDHGGQIYLDGKKNNGTLFTIMLPFAIPEESSPLTSLGATLSAAV
jgi:signal transduction histidine kinase